MPKTTKQCISQPMYVCICYCMSLSLSLWLRFI